MRQVVYTRSITDKSTSVTPSGVNLTESRHIPTTSTWSVGKVTALDIEQMDTTSRLQFISAHPEYAFVRRYDTGSG